MSDKTAFFWLYFIILRLQEKRNLLKKLSGFETRDFIALRTPYSIVVFVLWNWLKRQKKVFLKDGQVLHENICVGAYF